MPPGRLRLKEAGKEHNSRWLLRALDGPPYL